MDVVRSYRDLRAWQLGMDVVRHVYRSTALFPEVEKFGLVSQMRRAAVSVPSNITEGHARRSTREYCRFLEVALGSLAELETQILIANELGYLKEDAGVDIGVLSNETGKVIRGLYTSLRRRASTNP